jgi:hypothetical protein
MPLSDWRDGFERADGQEGWPAIYDRAYLQANIAGGEGFDWFYASAADRSAQVRTPITDGAASKPWVFRYRDLRAWWSNEHYDRPGGVDARAGRAVEGDEPGQRIHAPARELLGPVDCDAHRARHRFRDAARPALRARNIAFDELEGGRRPVAGAGRLVRRRRRPRGRPRLVVPPEPWSAP